MAAKKALYLAGGGARGAYQAGVLKAISYILQVKTLPFNMITGVSVGSINAAMLANYADDFPMAVERLETVWSDIQTQQVFNISNFSLIKSIFRNVTSFFIKQQNSGHFLDTQPLLQFINENIDFSNIAANIAQGHLETLEIITNCYETQKTISFYDVQHAKFEDWVYPRHASVKTNIKAEHILASGSLPLFFPAIAIDQLHYSDGSIGLITPLRGAIRFKMDKILIIGTRHADTINLTTPLLEDSDIGFAYVLGNMLDGLFLDNLDHDIDMVNRMNEIALLLSIWKKRYAQWRPIKTKYLRPSLDLANIAQNMYKTMPIFLRFLLSMFGNKSHSGDLVSFLLFEKEFTRELINLGYKDTMANASDIEEFFS
jgi:NTE family protein